MERIASFSVDHERLNPGLYVSRQDFLKGGVVLTSFDIRFKAPNREPVMDIASMHTIEHLGATWLRNHETWGGKTIYFGPMGCRTGFYLILEGDLTSQEILPVMKDLFKAVADWQGDIPGATAIECGNWQEHNLAGAKREAVLYEKVLTNAREENLNYPS